MISSSLDKDSLLFLIAAFTAGAAFGAVYFTALWHTVRQLPSAKSPARLLLISYIFRVAAVLAGFYLVMGAGHWERLIAATLGFIIVRKILTYHLGPQNAAGVIH
ncbi:MAG: ATP synthase subunit I [Deltaproteobacteria bacterium HGW-Deltaproteobacteria-7]|nr:MAG: ATP synthase subunit I [Deltaproteobacteria bacterium HGW-Deltaproteobacteria-7]PKN53658.1 MAG: ATP synthase subunit I [Deltaproteobacteria bacterium HGW-Deltaproteobacteria-13]